jgi:hypothetical protein
MSSKKGCISALESIVILSLTKDELMQALILIIIIPQSLPCHPEEQRGSVTFTTIQYSMFFFLLFCFSKKVRKKETENQWLHWFWVAVRNPDAYHLPNSLQVDDDASL